MRHAQNIRSANCPQEILNSRSNAAGWLTTRGCEALRFLVPSVPLIGPSVRDVVFCFALPKSVMNFREPRIGPDGKRTGDDLRGLEGAPQRTGIRSIKSDAAELQLQSLGL